MIFEPCKETQEVVFILKCLHSSINQRKAQKHYGINWIWNWIFRDIFKVFLEFTGTVSLFLKATKYIAPVMFIKEILNEVLPWLWQGASASEMTSFNMLGLTLSFKLDLDSYISSITKTTSKKIGALIHSMKFFSPEVALYLYKSTIQPCMEYCCHVWAGASNGYLELWDKLQKQICRTAGPSLAALFEPLAHQWNVANLSLFCWYYFGRCSSQLAELVPLPYSQGGSTHYSDRLLDFSVTMSTGSICLPL